MLINLDYQSRLPIYEQIVLNIERYVALGILKENEQIPSVRALASSIGINPNTVKKAYDELETKGIIVTISTKGTFITKDIKKVIDNKINNEIEDIKEKIANLEKLGISKKEILKRLESSK